MEDSFGLLVTLFLGLFSVIRFRQLGKFIHQQSKGISLLLPSKWDILFLQILFIIIGSLFFTVSLAKLISLTGIHTSNNLLYWLLVFWGIYFVLSFRQVRNLVLQVSKKNLGKENLFKIQIAIVLIGIILSLIGIVKIFMV